MAKQTFTTSDIIRIHENAFEYYGGMPEEIVYDQDHVILVSENYGDLIYTREFAGYHQKRLKYICAVRRTQKVRVMLRLPLCKEMQFRCKNNRF